MYLEVEPHVEEPLKCDLGSESDGEEPGVEAESATEVETLCTALAEARSQNEALSNEVDAG